MYVVIHPNNIAELQADGLLISELQDALDLIYNPALEGANKIILHQHNISPAFFELQTRLAGDILQKFVQYRIQVVIVGYFQQLASKSLADFIRESNRGRHVFFVENLKEALDKLK